MSTHTPGPWRYSMGEQGFGFHISPPAGGTICEWWPAAIGKSEIEAMKANARLIAEAPEMLEIFEQLIDQSQGCTCPNNGGGDCAWCQAVLDAKLVIEEAKGK